MDSPQAVKSTDLKLLVSHKLSVGVDALIGEAELLFRQTQVHYLAVLENDRLVGLISRDARSEALARTGLLGGIKRTKIRRAVRVREAMIPDPIVIEHGTEPDVVFEAVFGRPDDRLSEDIILANEDGTFFGIISAKAIMRLLYGFLGNRMRELRLQKETLAFEHSQVIKVRRDLELTNEKLALSRDRALEGVRMKTQFLANMSHEIRTPMNGVFGMIDLLDGTKLDNDQKQLVATARSSVETLMRIINDILDFSKIEAGKVSIEMMPFNLVQVVEASATLYSEAASSKEINLTVRFEDAPAWVVGDPHRYQQVLNNLVSNALKFTDAGSVEVYLTAAKTKSGPGILTEVRDTGIGVSPSKVATLFKPFTQADDSHARKYGGTGLGLSICKNLVDLFGGSINCDSEIGRGTVFSFILPFAPHVEVGAEHKEHSVNQRLTCHASTPSKRKDFDGMRVLLVEDNLVNQEVARRFLKELNCKVCLADNGEVALEYLRRESFDCVFMDCQMPVLDGYEAACLIRRGAVGQAHRDVFISAMTAHAMSGDQEKCLEWGMDHYVSKPCGLHDFRRALEMAVEKSEVKSARPRPWKEPTG